MKNLLTAFILFLSFNFFAQKNSAKVPEALYNCWSASYEEDNEKTAVKTFRNCDYKFPPKMFRPTVKINKDGTAQVLHVGPTDMHEFVECTWTYDKRKKRVTVLDKSKKVEMKFKIKRVEKDILKIVEEK